ncbi:type II toxin-antitoxin system RelE/ParE family toxin [Pseudidiomarina gelatinasegens]|uniref:type II toxin-antitoxin system RelE/ParE family toxin n=1 Tax=Pseudidiomarina gelatinasegens TaxID=2487740 RepID=UPI003A97B75C
MDILTTSVFDMWFGTLKDLRGKSRIQARIDRIACGHLGDVKSVGDGILEIRVFSGPGYRVYFKQYGDTFIVLLVGGDKSSQHKDIERAKQLVKDIGDSI